jgi:hypothetical protein
LRTLGDLRDLADRSVADDLRLRLETLIRTCPAGDRGAARDRLVEAVGQRVPKWEWMVERVAAGAMKKR